MDTEEQNIFLENMILQAADDADVHKRPQDAKKVEKRREIKDLPELTATERRQMRNSINKQIQKEIKRTLGRRKQDKIEQILLEFRGLNERALCTKAKRRAHMVEMEENGYKHSDQDGIAEVFASFDEKLYTRRKIVESPNTTRTQGENCRWF